MPNKPISEQKQAKFERTLETIIPKELADYCSRILGYALMKCGALANNGKPIAGPLKKQCRI